MDQLIQKLQAVSGGLYKVQKILLIVSSVLMVGVNCVQVVCRYLYKTSIPWCEQGSVALFMLMILLGGNIAMKTDNEIKIEVIHFKNANSDRLFKLFADMITIFTLVCLMIGSIFLVKQAIKFPQSLATLPLKYYHLYFMLILGFGMMLLDKTICFLCRLRGQTTPKEDEEV